MTSIKLPRIPDRSPVKIAIHVPPELARALDDYAEFYARSYASTEPVTELIPAMLQAFLESDRAFVKSRRGAASGD
ncbi:DUF2274 domain-containing protein [Sphingomonas sabuli]|uniref:DUF2274 domain-containing protein n=1 Tax=Sphingomonas sabuli TaxID=2764186 RepID=A0A7G9L3U9_9SPHN|nr:DUF2274 domain-containing protein [Sphingomonas sabuli]QNM83298.1 DUF2274 domain-containing protein [Sphingomonas sabuli]